MYINRHISTKYKYSCVKPVDISKYNNNIITRMYIHVCMYKSITVVFNINCIKPVDISKCIIVHLFTLLLEGMD